MWRSGWGCSGSRGKGEWVTGAVVGRNLGAAVDFMSSTKCLFAAFYIGGICWRYIIPFV